ncbi:unnamed protein product [Parajaminaea phylloscopi]
MLTVPVLRRSSGCLVGSRSRRPYLSGSEVQINTFGSEQPTPAQTRIAAAAASARTGRVEARRGAARRSPASAATSASESGDRRHRGGRAGARVMVRVHRRGSSRGEAPRYPRRGLCGVVDRPYDCVFWSLTPAHQRVLPPVESVIARVQARDIERETAKLAAAFLLYSASLDPTHTSRCHGSAMLRLFAHQVQRGCCGPSSLPRCSASSTSALIGLPRHASNSRPHSQSTDDDQDTKARLAWADEVKQRRSTPEGRAKRVIPKNVIDVTFSTSSGPGGQNVNKVSTKATVRLRLKEAVQASRSSGHASPLPLPVPPSVVTLAKAQSSYYVASSHSLLVSSSATRSQRENLDNALDKLRDELYQLATQGIAGETSAEQKRRVSDFVARERVKMRNVKSQRKDVKAGRGKVML